jgi:hypothetical protein
VITDVNLIAPETNAGNFSACGNSSQQYINYTLDGTDHKISTAANDSLEGFVTILSQPNPSDYTNIIGSHGAADYIQFRFLNNNNTAGTFPIKYLAFDAADSSTVLVQPFNISITGNAQNVGEFYEGQFSGQFTRYSTGSALHNINCSFRVRRQQ